MTEYNSLKTKQKTWSDFKSCNAIILFNPVELHTSKNRFEPISVGDAW